MIKVTRLDGESFVLNADLIRYVEARPDTFITLTSGERVVVTETMDEVMARAITYQQMKQLIPAPGRPLAETAATERLAGNGPAGPCSDRVTKLTDETPTAPPPPPRG